MIYRSIQIFTVSLLFLLSACEITPKELRERESDRQLIFIAPDNYQSVYRKILSQARVCYQATYFNMTRTEVQGDLFYDTKSGTITVSFHSGMGMSTEDVIDISSVNEQHTQINVYYSGDRQYGEIIKEWVLDNSKECWQEASSYVDTL